MSPALPTRPEWQTVCHPDCAARQARLLLTRYATKLLAVGLGSMARHHDAAAQQRVDLARMLLDLTERLNQALTSAPPLPDQWATWRALLLEVHTRMPRLSSERRETDLEHLIRRLLERMQLVRWTDPGAVLVNPLPRLAKTLTKPPPFKDDSGVEVQR